MKLRPEKRNNLPLAPMVIFPNCKINLGLRILRKRDDGFHDLETVFYPIMIRDVLEIIENHDRKEDEKWLVDLENVRFNQTGILVDGKPSDNLAIKAYYLLKKDFPQLPAIQMHLHKAIPIGAGLGGGSADGALALRLLNEKFHLGLTTDQIIVYAAELGSDCPFFIINEPCLATGRGDQLKPLTLDLSRFSWLILSPGIHINTSWAFTTISLSMPALPLSEIIRQPVENWKKELINDFEIPVFNQYPEIRKIKEKLYDHGALYAAMTGSGSSVFALFPKNEIPENVFPEKDYKIHRIL